MSAAVISASFLFWLRAVAVSVAAAAAPAEAKKPAVAAVDWSGLGQTLLGADFLRFDDILSR
ncbi:hypothetical protein TYRP_002739 [Tyrophagus putrescentiae]|nr:hypothetical protein TYRP_002739 [Tyrophagus putrescentiae]